MGGGKKEEGRGERKLRLKYMGVRSVEWLSLSAFLPSFLPSPFSPSTSTSETLFEAPLKHHWSTTSTLTLTTSSPLTLPAPPPPQPPPPRYITIIITTNNHHHYHYHHRQLHYTNSNTNLFTTPDHHSCGFNFRLHHNHHLSSPPPPPLPALPNIWATINQKTPWIYAQRHPHTWC